MFSWILFDSWLIILKLNSRDLVRENCFRWKYLLRIETLENNQQDRTLRLVSRDSFCELYFDRLNSEKIPMHQKVMIAEVIHRKVTIEFFVILLDLSFPRFALEQVEMDKYCLLMAFFVYLTKFPTWEIHNKHSLLAQEYSIW